MEKLLAMPFISLQMPSENSGLMMQHWFQGNYNPPKLIRKNWTCESEK